MTMNRPNLPIPPRRLLVADSMAARKVLGALLRKDGYDVVEAETGQDALQKMRSTLPDLAVLNVQLSDQSGLDVLRTIRGDAELEHVPVVLLSQLRFSPEEQAEGLDAGAEGYIAGPIANAELLARLRVYVRQGDLLNQLSASEKRFRDLLEHQTDGVVVVDKESGVVRFANEAAEKSLAVRRIAWRAARLDSTWSAEEFLCSRCRNPRGIRFSSKRAVPRRYGTISRR